MYSIELTQEVSNLPCVPKILREDLKHAWYATDDNDGYAYNSKGMKNKEISTTPLSHHILSKVLSSLSHAQEKELNHFETEFKNFYTEVCRF